MPINGLIYNLIGFYPDGCSNLSPDFQTYPVGIPIVQSQSLKYFLADKKLYFQLNNNSFLGDEILIYNELGQQIAATKIENENPQIDLSAFPAGIYFYQICNSQKTVSGKFLLN